MDQVTLTHIEHQIAELQRQAEALRTTTDDPQLPAAWRKLVKGQGWYRYLQLPPAQHELALIDGWEPLHLRQQRMPDHQARALARAHSGVALVRATEQRHGIH
jgi:hypothetical protein